jgi:hypothetical protein
MSYAATMIATFDWLSLLAVVVTLVPLVLLERWIHQHLHGIGLLLTGSQDAAVLLYALPLLPGVVLHELSHWLVAKLLGVKTAKVSLLPKRQRGGRVQLGAVIVQQTDFVRASLIGVAPLVSGSLVVLVIGERALGVGLLGEALRTGDIGAIFAAWLAALRAPDMWLWLYLLFAVANAMLPSPSDRETWPPVILFLVGIVVVAYVLGFSSFLLELAPLAVSALRWLAAAFAVTLVADAPFVILILCAEWLLGTLRGQRVFYKK